MLGSLLIALSLIFGMGGVAIRSVAEAGESSSAACSTAASSEQAEAKVSLQEASRRLHASSTEAGRVIPLNTRGYNYAGGGDTMPSPNRPRPTEPEPEGR